MSVTIRIDNRLIGDDEDCYVIAEIGNNHQGDIELAKKLIDAAKLAGCDAAKFQKRCNSKLYSKEMYDRHYDSENAFAETYGAHREALELPIEAFAELKRYSESVGITFFATAFDAESADELFQLDLPAYKIASSDLTNLPLLRQVAGFGKPIIISTGYSSMEDVERAYEAILPINPQLAILQCTSSYPAEVETLNLHVIETFRARFPEAVIGFSGHENGIAMPLVAYMLGARIVEKHFTLNRTMKGTDHAFSLTGDGMRRMVRDLKRVRVALGKATKEPLPCEVAPMRKMLKVVVAARDLPAGAVLTEPDMALRVCGEVSGLRPYELGDLVGRRLRSPVPAETRIEETVLE
jgi:N-acetylneuraminate synthase/sialic acid synthase